MTMFKAMKRLDDRVVSLSFVMYFALVIPVSSVHEWGHGLACQSIDGNTYQVFLTFRGMATQCLDSSGNDSDLQGIDKINFYLSGPMMGAVTSIGIMVLGNYLRHKYPVKSFLGIAIMSVGIAYIVDQGSKVILEGFFTQVYLSGVFDVYLTALQIFALMVPVFKFGMKQKANTKVPGVKE